MEFPLWLRATHVLNVLFLTLLMRSGIEILSAHPKLYWNDDCRPGSAWLSFTRKRQPQHELWTSRDEEEGFSPWLALPGGRNLGLGRHWHFFSVVAWVLTGLVYVLSLFVFDEWRRLVPTSWAVVPDAWRALRTYLSLQLPPIGNAYNALQLLAYAAVVFLLGPLAIATGAAMSPAIAARFPWYTRLFGGRQAARSLHFITLLAFAAFTLIHTIMVIAHGLPRGLANIVLGRADANRSLAVLIGLASVVVIAVVHILATRSSLRWPRHMQRALQLAVDPAERVLLQRLTSHQRYPPESVSPYFRVNGRPPADTRYDAMARADFADWTLEVGGLVERSLHLSLADLRALPQQTQVTKHVCIQGWSAVASWTGTPLRDVIDLCRPLAQARYLVLYAMDDKSVTEADSGGTGRYYETIDLELARHPQTLLAYAMNDQPLSVIHGAPLRLRVETQLGFKMVKWLSAIEFVAEYRAIGDGQGGWREDNQYYSQAAGI